MCSVFAFLDNPLMLLLLGAIAVMLFGERLPEVARSFGKSVMEIKKGMRGLQDEIQSAVNSATSVDSPRQSPSYYDESYGESYGEYNGEPDNREEATAPKFEPPPTS